MKRLRSEAVIVTIAIVIGSPARAGAGAWNLESWLGAAAGFSTPLTVRQGAHPDIAFDAVWATRSLDQPLYYAWRISRWSEDRAWIFGLTHLKMHLKNGPPDIQSFSVSHGYNLLTVGRLWRRASWHAGGAAGVVIAHPENTVRGISLAENDGLLHDGYYVAGPAAEALLGWRHSVGPWLAVALEGRLSAAFARVRVSGGSADVPSIALHGLVGLALCRQAGR